MITRDQAFSATEFHISHGGLPCTVWRRSSITYDLHAGGFFVPIERDGEDGDRHWHHITGVNAGDFHVANECPHVLRTGDDRPPVEPMLSISDRSEDGRDEWGYDPAGYDRNGYDRNGYDRNGYDSDGYDSGGYDADGYDANGYDADGAARPGSLDLDDLDLGDLWSEFRYSRFSTPDRQEAFRQHLRELVRDPDDIDSLGFCGNCEDPAWDGDLSSAQNGNVRICESCWDDWMTCDRCDDRYPDDDMTCTLDESNICDRCRHNYYSWCDDCDGWYPDEYADDHAHGSDGDGCCESPQQEFAVRNDGDEPLANDTRFTVALPAGTISGEGLTAIRDYLYRQGSIFWDLSYDLDKLGNQWQTKGGNYTRRLSRLAYQDHQLKLTQDVMSQVGCIAREHSTQVSVAIEVTRDLNMSAGEFCNDDSCYWGSYSESRCALKTNGGFGLRSFSAYGVTGRAWVLPLRRDEHGTLRPTFDTLTPDAFVVFNGYGDLSGYAAPRIVAHMAGWTYRKIDFSANPMYINAGGYLVAPEDIAQPYTDGHLSLRVSQHSSLFNTERELVNA